MKTLAGGIEFKKVWKSFGDRSILRDLSLKADPQKSLVIMGQSGVGKSVLLKCLLGFMSVDKGKIWMDHQSIEQETTLQRESRFQKSGVLFQSSALLDTLTIGENIGFRLGQILPKAKAQARVKESLNLVGLSAKTADLYPDELSGGMRRRASLARAIATNPAYLFFDEPTAGLDPIFSTKMSLLIRECVVQLGATALTITHDVRCAQLIGDEIAFLHEGQIAWKGKASEVSTTPNPMVQQFVQGNPEGPLSTCL